MRYLALYGMEDGKDPMDQQKHTQPVVRRARGLQRIASILDAAEVVFARMGYEEATTNHIAAQAEISPGSLYQFFSNKEEIAQALASRYTEELQLAYDTIFSVEATALPLPLWLDQIFDTLFAFHLSHPAFHILLNTPVSSRVTSLARALPQELQARFELGFERRAPTLSPTQRCLSATMSVQLFKATLLLVLGAEEDKRRLLVCELKTVLRRYLEPLLG
jgi:AcrR family transcriptional regulator